MRVTKITMCVIFFLMGASMLWAGENDGARKIVIEIEYGKNHEPRTVEVLLEKSQTVLELLQKVSTVETHPAGKYVFVTAIDEVAGKRGETAWYYTIDGESPKEVAYSKVIDKESHIKWTYKKDVCSWQVDGVSETIKK
jgi:hypothetical protein